MPSSNAISEPGGTPAPQSPERESLHDLVARINAEVAAADPAPRASDESGAAPQRRYVVFSLAGRRCALAIGSVLETGYLPPLTRVPNVPSWIAGVANLRGEVVAVLDLGAWLGLDGGAPRAAGRLVVVHSARLDGIAGLRVEALHGLLATQAQGSAKPAVAGDERLAPFTMEWLEQDGEPLAVLDLESVFEDPKMQRLRRG